MTDPVCLEVGSAADLDSIMPVMRASFSAEFGEAWTLPQCSGMLALPGSQLVLAKHCGQVIGFALARTIIDQTELMLLAVAPDQQRLGTGKLLLNRIMSDAAAQGAVTLHVEVRINNPALDFYFAAGFARAGYRPNYYRSRQGQLTDAVTLIYAIV